VVKRNGAKRTSGTSAGCLGERDRAAKRGNEPLERALAADGARRNERQEAEEEEREMRVHPRNE